MGPSLQIAPLFIQKVFVTLTSGSPGPPRPPLDQRVGAVLEAAGTEASEQGRLEEGRRPRLEQSCRCGVEAVIAQWERVGGKSSYNPDRIG